MGNTNVWNDLGINETLASELANNGIGDPTPVQAEAIPAMLAGQDLSVKSQTGSGKTLAYLLPLLQMLKPESSSIGAVILSPTQELAMQIVRVAELYAKPLGIRVQQLIGGAAMKRQIEKLKLRPHLVIGTPGRIHELLKQRKLKLNDVKHVVIDEADQMFQLGSSKDLETILFNLNKQRQIAFFSATFPQDMIRYEGRWMKDPLRIGISPEHQVAPTIEHYYVVCDKRDKPDVARRLVRLINPSSALLFINDTDEIANWEAKLNYEGFKAEAIYGDANKQRRAATLSRFREGTCELLIATDVAARGLDIESLQLVLQLDPAIDADHYVHRAGRTGRMGRSGTVISIITPQERFIMNKFSKTLGIELSERTMFKGKLLTEEELSEATRYKPASKAVSSRGNQVRQPQEKQATVSSDKRTVQRDSKENSPIRQERKPKVEQKTKADQKSKRKRDEKNKGAPKWLKEKRNTASKE